MLWLKSLSKEYCKRQLLGTLHHVKAGGGWWWGDGSANVNNYENDACTCYLQVKRKRGKEGGGGDGGACTTKSTEPVCLFVHAQLLVPW